LPIPNIDEKKMKWDHLPGINERKLTCPSHNTGNVAIKKRLIMMYDTASFYFVLREDLNLPQYRGVTVVV
jgi:hypothetical protein